MTRRPALELVGGAGGNGNEAEGGREGLVTLEDKHGLAEAARERLGVAECDGGEVGGGRRGGCDALQALLGEPAADRGALGRAVARPVVSRLRAGEGFASSRKPL
jgi:hypothetical protein